MSLDGFSHVKFVGHSNISRIIKGHVIICTWFMHALNVRLHCVFA